jgi:AcrR family transcriptional regulator
MSVKSEETRGRILAAALELFRSRGFDSATMRDIAAASGVAIGAAYYYFDSKDAIVLAFYDQARNEMKPRLEEALAGSRALEERLRALLAVKFAYFEPDRALLGALSAHTDPANPLSPFSEQTKEIRNADIEFFDRAVCGSRVRVADDVKPYLPRLLWLYQMGLILFWIHDRSPGQKQTRALTEKSLRIVVGLIKFSSYPLMQPLRRAVVDLLETVMA